MDILRLNMHFTMVKVQAFFVHNLSVKCLCRSNQACIFTVRSLIAAHFCFARILRAVGRKDK